MLRFAGTLFFSCVGNWKLGRAGLQLLSFQRRSWRGLIENPCKQLIVARSVTLPSRLHRRMRKVEVVYAATAAGPACCSAEARCGQLEKDDKRCSWNMPHWSSQHSAVLPQALEGWIFNATYLLKLMWGCWNSSAIPLLLCRGLRKRLAGSALAGREHVLHGCAGWKRQSKCPVLSASRTVGADLPPCRG